MAVWNGWYHCMANTYGTWLPGDPRGFRTRQHREHVEGDYKQPPPTGKYDQRHQVAMQRMKREAVMLTADARNAVMEAIVYALVEVHQIQVLSLSVSEKHMHVLARFGDVASGKPTASRCGLRERDPARYFMGIAKERSAKKLAAEGLVTPGRVWARKGKIIPVRDRAHQVNVYRYVLNHAQEDAVVWSFNDQ